METTVNSMPTKEKFDNNVVTLFSGYINTRVSSFEEQLNKLTETEIAQ